MKGAVVSWHAEYTHHSASHNPRSPTLACPPHTLHLPLHTLPSPTYTLPNTLPTLRPPITLKMLQLLLLALLPAVAHAVCDGNPHAWGRLRRCDQYSAACPGASWASNCSVCEGIGGIASGDTNTPATFTPTYCRPVGTAAQMKDQGVTPVWPRFPDTFVNTGFHGAF